MKRVSGNAGVMGEAPAFPGCSGTAYDVICCNCNRNFSAAFVNI